MENLLQQLIAGPVYFFSQWPNERIPHVAAGVYTIWKNEVLIYVGMSGRSLTKELITFQRKAGLRGKGLYSRLQSHAHGRRSGDQFCVYVADRLVLPTLNNEQIDSIASGRHSMDVYVREYIHENLSYRFAETTDGVEARKAESMIKNGELSCGPPLLNPGQGFSFGR
jgi:hypothetical protein